MPHAHSADRAEVPASQIPSPSAESLLGVLRLACDSPREVFPGVQIRVQLFGFMCWGSDPASQLSPAQASAYGGARGHQTGLVTQEGEDTALKRVIYSILNFHNDTLPPREATLRACWSWGPAWLPWFPSLLFSPCASPEHSPAAPCTPLLSTACCLPRPFFVRKCLRLPRANQTDKRTPPPQPEQSLPRSPRSTLPTGPSCSPAGQAEPLPACQVPKSARSRLKAQPTCSCESQMPQPEAGAVFSPICRL